MTEEPLDYEMDVSGAASDEKQADGSEGNDSAIDSDEMDNFADESSEGESESGDGNVGWADAMARVLHTSTKSTNFILSKAKKDADIRSKKDKQVEVVDETGQVIKNDTQEKTKSYSEKRKEMIEKQKQKSEWETMCRVKPDVTNKERERELVRIATRGVVHLFNTVEKHQKTIKGSKNKSQKEKKLSVVKGNFMDILKECSKKDTKVEDDPAVKKAKQEETWSILKDDFMMGAEMKDWDKDDENT